MQIVPLQPTPNQTVVVSLDGQVCQINVYQTARGLFTDLYVDNSLVIGGVLCHDRCRIVRSAYLGFSGDLSFLDNQGTSDPDYTGLGPDVGSRFNLAYLEPGEL